MIRKQKIYTLTTRISPKVRQANDAIYENQTWIQKILSRWIDDGNFIQYQFCIYGIL